MHEHVVHVSPLATRGLAIAAPSGQSLFMRLLTTVSRWQQRAATRRQLAALDDRLLRDIGIDRATAAIEAAKPFWKP